MHESYGAIRFYCGELAATHFAEKDYNILLKQLLFMGRCMEGMNQTGIEGPQPPGESNHRRAATLLRAGTLLLAGMLLSACALSALSERSNNPTPSGVNNAIEGESLETDADLTQATAILTATSTATPRPSMTPTPAELWGSYAAPKTSSATEIPRPVPGIGEGEQFVHILLLGSDERSSSGGYRTDSILLLSLNLEEKTMHLTSIPRDLYVYIPGWRVDRINTADARGGFEMLAQTIEYNFGIEIDHWVRANFNSFIDVVDTLGGIRVESTGTLNDECGGKWWRYSPGIYEMDGFEALCYVRMRKTSSDFDRLRRQQEVVKALLEKAISLDALKQFGTLYQQFSTGVDTDLGYAEGVRLVAQSLSIAADPDNIHTIRIDRSVITSWKVPSTGAQVLLPNYEAIEELLRAAFDGDPG